jgi:3-oxoacyl-[acyl-carrier-protein] synthase II
MRAFIEKGPSRVSPFFVPMFMANVASAIVSMRFGFQGPCYCTVSACASSGHALGDAYDLIRADKADVMVAGGSEAAITPLALASFANMKALSERNDDPKTASRPFDKDRDGFVMGDGAAVVILEEWERAKARGANIVAEKTFTPLNVRSGRTTRLPETSRAIGASVLPERSRGCGFAHKEASAGAEESAFPGSPGQPF